jgi:hypothetical protein
MCNITPLHHLHLSRFRKQPHNQLPPATVARWGGGMSDCNCCLKAAFTSSNSARRTSSSSSRCAENLKTEPTEDVSVEPTSARLRRQHACTHAHAHARTHARTHAHAHTHTHTHPPHNPLPPPHTHLPQQHQRLIILLQHPLELSPQLPLPRHSSLHLHPRIRQLHLQSVPAAPPSAIAALQFCAHLWQ